MPGQLSREVHAKQLLHLIRPTGVSGLRIASSTLLRIAATDQVRAGYQLRAVLLLFKRCCIRLLTAHFCNVDDLARLHGRISRRPAELAPRFLVDAFNGQTELVACGEEALPPDLAERRPAVDSRHFDWSRPQSPGQVLAQLLFRRIRPGQILGFGCAGSLLGLVLALPLRTTFRELFRLSRSTFDRWPRGLLLCRRRTRAW